MDRHSTSSAMQRGPVIILLALFCTILWGTAYPAVKIGYELFAIDAADGFGKLLFAGLMTKLLGGKGKDKGEGDGKIMGFDVTPDMMAMMGGFTVLRLTSMMGMANISFTKEELLKMNAQLNKIRKPKK